MWGIHRSPVNSSYKGQWRGALMFALICVWINGWVNNPEAGDLRLYRARYDVTVMYTLKPYMYNVVSSMHIMVIHFRRDCSWMWKQIIEVWWLLPSVSIWMISLNTGCSTHDFVFANHKTLVKLGITQTIVLCVFQERFMVWGRGFYEGSWRHMVSGTTALFGSMA